MSEVLERVNREMAAIVEHVRPSLVQLRHGRRGMGAGTVWHADGLIVTNAHVVHQRAPQATLSDGRTVSTHVVAMDTEHDLAALCVAATGLTAVTLAEPSTLQPGHWVLALGHPWGGAGALTAGIVIGIGAAPERPQRQGEWIHVDLHLRPGYSGGPLVDVHGRVVGINTMSAGPNVGLAVPLAVVQGFVRHVRDSQ
jgi:S1-C subfamily serine protease